MQAVAAPTAAVDGGRASGEGGGAGGDGAPEAGRSLGGVAGRSGASPHEGSAARATHASARIGVAGRARTQGQSIRQSTEYSTRPQATRSRPDGTSPSAWGKTGSRVMTRLSIGSASSRRRIAVRPKSCVGS